MYPVENLKKQVINITEGEWDSLVGLSMGLNCLTVTGGAGSWEEIWSKRFKDKEVRIVFDSDAAGQIGAARVAKQLKGIAKSIKIINLFCDFFNLRLYI